MIKGDPLSFKPLALLLALVTLAAFLTVGCSGAKSTTQASPGATSTAAVGTPQTYTATGYCNPQIQVIDPTLFQLQVKAQWKGNDRITIEGSVRIPPTDLQYVICQNGEVSLSLVPAKKPVVEDGSISAESKLVSSDRGPAFDPNAQFEAVLYFLSRETRIPMLTATVPVEGRPQ